MTRKEALAELIAKVEADAWDCRSPQKGMAGLKSAKRFRLAVSAYNESLDAAKALHEAALPGWEWGVMSHLDGKIKPGVFVARLDKPEIGFEASNQIPARAWLLAILKTLHSEEPE